jgi:hypothetical protein
MLMTKTRHYLNALLLIFIALFICNVAYAALYNIVNTDDFVNGVPSTLTTKERAKLVTTTITKTEASCIAGKCKLLDKATAKNKIKAIIASETCNPATHTGTWPNCVPIVVPPPPPPPPATSLMPFVDVTKNVVPAVGYSTLRIKPTSQQPETKEEGAFRVVCSVSHMNNDDPMVFPGQPNATHHHTYYGHTGVKYDTDLSTLSASGNSTCNGGIMNRTAYWHPSMIDTATNAPVIPDGGALFYYKVGYGVNPTQVKPPPKGLRMLAGNPKATNASESQAVKFVCINKATQNSNGMPWQKTIPNCSTDTYMQMVVEHPSCWDGKNLDSPNHKDHMAYKNGTSCPATHPVIIPVISLNMNFKVAFNGQMAKWRLSSDNYAWNGSNAGYSGHSDWVNGWDEPTMAGIVRNCLNQGKDAQAHLLCDGRMFE